MYNRKIESQLQESLFKGKIIILYGPRQVGKTTLVKKVMKTAPNSEYLTGDDSLVREFLSNSNLEALKSRFGGLKLLIIDEAQKITNIGNTLKLLVDNFQELQVIATGSSSFELANRLREPLTGRYFQYFLYPLSFGEILESQSSKFYYQEIIKKQLVFGSYPHQFDLPEKDRITELKLIAGDYLYRDIFALQEVKSPEILEKLAKSIALQLGSEVSFNELANHLNTTKETVQRYLDLLKKAFVIFDLRSFSRSLRKELGKSQKYYFYDLGIRNALISNFNAVDIRPDIGGLWENFCIVERMKLNHYHQKQPNSYFWRTYDQKEIDYIEEANGGLKTFEFKWNLKKKTKPPKLFLETYKEYNPTFETVTPENWLKFVD